jgi:pimeloyl-ACP methyl ester carboxylesterase
MLRLSSLMIGCLFASAAMAASPAPVYGPELQGFDYPYPLRHYAFDSQGKALRMGYMDVAATGKANGHTVVLMHGKNFCAATWESSIKVLSDAGYRVVAPDQIGFCTSTKPEAYQYSFQQLASNTHGLLDTLGIDKAIVLGHSTGGMLATRYALMYPNQADRVGQHQALDLVGLEGPRRALAHGGPMAGAGTQTGCRQRAPLRTGHLLRRPLEARVRALGDHARRPQPGPRA